MLSAMIDVHLLSPSERSGSGRNLGHARSHEGRIDTLEPPILWEMSPDFPCNLTLL